MAKLKTIYVTMVVTTALLGCWFVLKNLKKTEMVPVFTMTSENNSSSGRRQTRHDTTWSQGTPQTATKTSQSRNTLRDESFLRGGPDQLPPRDNVKITQTTPKLAGNTSRSHVILSYGSLLGGPTDRVETHQNAKISQSQRAPKLATNTTQHHVITRDGPVLGSCDLLTSLRAQKNTSGLIKPDCSSSSFLVYSCGAALCGGLADRLKGIISTFILARVTNRTFVISHRKPCPLSESLAPNLYDWQHCAQYVSKIARHETTTVRYFEGSLDKDLKAKTKMDFGRLVKKRLTYFQTNMNIFPEWVKEDKRTKHILPGLYNTGCNIDSDVLNILFKPSPKLTKNIDAFVAQKRNKRLVCSHMRVGKNPTLPFDSARYLNVSNMFQFLDRYSHSNESVIFVATDSEAVRKQVHRRYSNSVSTGRQIVHVDRFYDKVNVCAGLYTAVLEMQLLSKCDVLLLSFSGYGAMAARTRASSDNLFCHRGGGNESIVPCRYEGLTKLYGFT